MRPSSNLSTAFLFLATLALPACSSIPGDPDLAASAGAIMGGTADTTDDAVQALLKVDQMGNQASVGACSGTTIATRGASAFYLTAAHCVVQYNAQRQIVMPVKVADPSTLLILPGNDWSASYDQGLVFPVVDVKVHPQYDGNVSNPFDLAVVRYLGATSATHVLPALAPQEDMLTVGTMVTIVGYGETETSMQNTVRRKVDKPIARLSTQQLQYDQSDRKGPCEGDSGGPAIVQTPNGARVAAVTSFGDAQCTQIGVSVRTSYQIAFIQSSIDAAPTALTCDECSLAMGAPGNPCASQEIACQTTNSPCNQFYRCAAACTTNACITQCRTTYAAGAAAYSSLLACACGGMCTASCASEPACSGTGGTCGGYSDPRAACDMCIKQECCAEAAACKGNAACSACNLAATSACGTNITYRGLVTCAATCAGDPCQVLVTYDAGSNPTGGTGGSSGMPPDAGITLPGSQDASPTTTTGATSSTTTTSGATTSTTTGTTTGDATGTTTGDATGDATGTTTGDPGVGGTMSSASGSAGCSCRAAGSPDRNRDSLGVTGLALAVALASRRRRGAGTRISSRARPRIRSGSSVTFYRLRA